MAEDFESLANYKIENYDVLPEELDFDILEFGVDGDLEVVAKRREGLNPPCTLPASLPELFPDAKDELEYFLLHPEKLQIHDYQKSQKFWERERDPETLFRHEAMQNSYSLEMERDIKTGVCKGYKEISLSDVGLTARNSMSFHRQPGALSGSVKGEPSNYPFMPGGFTFETMARNMPDIKEDEIGLERDLLDLPPGFVEPIKFDFAQKADSPSSEDTGMATNVFNINEIFSGELVLGDLDVNEADSNDQQEEGNQQELGQPAEEQKLDDTANLDEDVLQVSEIVKTPPKSEKNKEEWAIIENTEHSVDDFHRLVPDMAHKFPFELDNFQKQAVLHLEHHECVFVAAHTSAGKTVVAEYAIALAQRHMTKAIYTSPIKALSNQKFRDFKNTFSDVGILTGDVQIRPDASCLVMTTEILRSMLYNGSDVIRDIEWVIFDEVHYINDASRGVVWEEVLIMLPDHVGIVLLSATVPNTYEFADWIGRTKRKKIYVISTYKRPVPLEHNLFTGNSTKTMNELFLLVDSQGKFEKRGYQAAVDALKSRAKKGKEAYGPKGGKMGNPKQDRSVWQAVLDMLKKKSQLPVVAFTFSRKQCDNNANQLTSVDLTTNVEKSNIHVFIKKCVSRLKGSDKQLPQVLWMGSLLNRGIGVHHSGILPILKEMVEMLFQKGLVKLLFATETFAMGVNMPARTVIFDSIRKHDGQSFRDLLPSEYTQMAGRAGRRGLDSTGVVIILCKNDVPEMADLHKMMMGKATLLQSRFRLTYSMILNLLQVEQLTMEDMMKRSFAEFSHQKETPEFTKRREALEQQINNHTELECPICATDLKQYYFDWKEFHNLKRQLQSFILTSQAGMRALTPGRVLVIANNRFHNSLAVLLQQGNLKQRLEISKDPLDKLFTVLVLTLKENETTAQDGLRPTAADAVKNPVISRQLSTPVGAACQIVEEVRGSDIAYITTKQIKTDPTRIIDDHKKRQIPRFRDDPPSETTVTAGQELLRMTDSNPGGITFMDAIKDFNMKYLDVVEKVKRLKQIEEIINSFQCIQCPQFLEHFSQVRNKMELKDELQRVKYLLSNESLELLPEYQQRIEVLKTLRYINKDQILKLKGRVARGISNNELMITELVFDNQLTHLKPTEIVALLSCFVCEAKKSSEPELTETLKEGVQVIKKCAKALAQIQKDCGLSLTEEEYVESFRFGLVQVVYEWARGIPFKEITELTDIPEGIIVRCIQRLDEICRDVKGAARIIGDPVLVDKMEQGSSLIKRDIVFTGSLYTS